ncbi:IS110 family transposase [Poseidonocella sp. HB161398]|uniref:IS110 family transposase n=1 Tax=Poseidonocella sp. HB161398 TaxID=2320855 RepID=UPI001109C8DE|nr:IS110 family transposase [Poseidonocella sp. HB161398]
MKHYAGLDVSLKEISICVVDETGAVQARKTVACDPAAVTRFFAEKRIAPVLTVHESGQLSIWLQRSLSDLGLAVTCVDARVAHKVLSARLNKSDAADAEGLAQLARTGWITPVHVRSLDADRLRTLIGARDRLLRLRNDLERHVRGVLKTFGIRMTGIHQGKLRQSFRDQLAEAASREPVFGLIAEGFMTVHATLCSAAAAIHKDLRDLAKESELARRLMTVPGVGAIVALNFIAVVDRADRFGRSASIGAFLGLTPRRYQSGETDYQGRISKCGDAAMRTLLFEAATSLMCRVKRFSPLKSWALRLAARKGAKRARVAAARKIAVLMLTLWKTGADFRWTAEAAA